MRSIEPLGVAADGTLGGLSHTRCWLFPVQEGSSVQVFYLHSQLNNRDSLGGWSHHKPSSFCSELHSSLGAGIQGTSQPKAPGVWSESPLRHSRQNHNWLLGSRKEWLAFTLNVDTTQYVFLISFDLSRVQKAKPLNISNLKKTVDRNRDCGMEMWYLLLLKGTSFPGKDKEIKTS